MLNFFHPSAMTDSGSWAGYRCVIPVAVAAIATLLQLAGTSQTRHVMVREMQINPLNYQISHIDFQRVMMDQKVRVKVHIELDGVPYGVKTEGGLLDFVTRDVEIECLPAAIPQTASSSASSRMRFLTCGRWMPMARMVPISRVRS